LRRERLPAAGLAAQRAVPSMFMVQGAAIQATAAPLQAAADQHQADQPLVVRPQADRPRADQAQVGLPMAAQPVADQAPAARHQAALRLLSVVRLRAVVRHPTADLAQAARLTVDHRELRHRRRLADRHHRLQADQRAQQAPAAGPRVRHLGLCLRPLRAAARAHRAPRAG
jgi:hypothetical protein